MALRGLKPRGFTLLEVVTAVFVFLVGIVGVLSLFASATMLHKGARDKTMAALVIQEILSDIDLRLKSGELRGPQGKLLPVMEEEVRGFERYRYKADFIEEADTGGGLVFARIELTWREKGQVRGESFVHFFRPGPEIGASVAAFRREAETSGTQPEEVEE
jgi:Tfp pilus assembly protein PilV